MKAFDPTLYFVTDPKLCGRRSLIDVVLSAARGGATLVQLREKHASRGEIKQIAQTLIALLTPRKVPLIINDHVKIAKEVGAAGVHLGKSDVSPQKAREILGKDFIIGVSIDGSNNLDHIPLEIIDYIAASPVFSTQTKLDLQTPLDISGLKALRRRCPLPLVAIGGVNLSNVESILEAGADGVAVVSAILDSENPEKAASKLKKAILDYRRRCGGI